MTAPADIQVLYASWRVGDGDPVVRVGHRRTVTLEAKPADGGTPDDWLPKLEPSEAPATGLWRLPGQPGGLHRLVGDVVTTYSAAEMFTAPWAGIVAGPWRLAAPGPHRGRVAGEVVLNDDSHMIDGPARVFASQEVDVVALNYVAGRWGPPTTDRGPWELLGWGTAGRGGQHRRLRCRRRRRLRPHLPAVRR